MRDGLDDARGLLPGVHLEPMDKLRGGDRSEVRRVRATWPDQPATTLIVKTFTRAVDGWVRESAALSIAPATMPSARLVAAGSAPQTVIMTDLGDGTTVADALLGDDAQAAADAVLLWAQTIGTLHRSTLASQHDFEAALAARSGDLPVSASTMSNVTDDAVRLLEEHCLHLEVTVPPGALSGVRDLPRRLNGSGAAALSPADACPDNNVRVGDGLALVDFEGATWRHIAWDVAYLTVPWPSCWCSWRMPGDVAERALERYRAAMEGDLPYVRTPEFRRDVAAAASGWALISTATFLSSALRDDAPPSDPRRLTPTRRAMILHRLDGARRSSDLPPVAELAGRLRDALVLRWGELPLAFAPAFDTGS